MSSEPAPAPSGSPEAPAASESPPKESAGAASGAAETNTLWVGNLSSHAGEDDVMSLFEPHGALDCALTRAGPRSYAFVLFRSPAEARAAVEATRGAKVKGAAIRTEFARQARAVKILWVAGISPSVSKEEVEDEFQKFGKIEGLAFSQDHSSAYIDFEKLEDAISAHRALNGKSLGGMELCVDFQRSKGRAEWSEVNNFSGRAPVEKRGTGPAKGSAMRTRAQPTNVLWVGFPGSYKVIDEDALRQAMSVYGVVTKTKVFPSRQYAFVEFASVAEAYNAKKNLDGHLFDDHRIQILFSNSELAPNKLDNPSLPAGFPRSEMYSDGRLGSGTLQGYDSPIRGRSRYSDYGGVTPGGVPRSPESFDPRDVKRMRLGAGAGADPYDVRAGSTGLYSGALRHQDSSVRSEGSSIPVIRVKGAVHRTSYLERVWRGNIAKGGSPVCRARCLPIGKGIDIPLPDVINCSARTGLDILAKHYADATGFDIVFFLPDSEDDFVSYTEFLRYLGSKSRAGVVKVDSGTTLFLVPPSDFLTNVLQVDGPERLYGVVLHIPQISAAAALRPQLAGPELQPYYDERETVSSLQRKYNFSSTDNSFPDTDYRGSSREDLMHHLGRIPRLDEGQTVQSAMAGFPANQSSGSQVQSSLKPDIMATLAKLMPSAQPSALVTGQVPMPSADRHASSQVHETWKPENQAPSNSSFGQSTNLQHPGQQFARQTSGAHLTNYGNMVGTQEFSTQHTAYNPEVTLNLPPPPPVPTLPHSSAMLPSQGGHSLPTQMNQQQYQPDQYYIPQSNYGHSNLQVSNVNIPAPPVSQVNPGPSLANNQMGSMAQLQNAMPVNVNRGNQAFSQGQQQQNSTPGAAQTSEEADKSKKYQATLQLAQSLLLQIQRGGTGNQP